MKNIPLKTQTTVRADDLGKTADKILNFFKKGWQKLVDIGLKVDDEVTYDEFGNRLVDVTTGSGNHMWVKFADTGKGKYVMKAYRKDDTAICTDTVTVEEHNIGKAITKFIDELFEEGVEEAKDYDTGEELVHTNSRTNIELTKVVSGTGYDIVLNKVYCNCSPADAEKYITNVVSSDELLSTLSETPTVLAVIDDGSDELDVYPCDDITEGTHDPILLMLAQSLRLRDLCQVAKWNHRDKYTDILYTICAECDFWGELFVEKCGSCCPPIREIINVEGGHFDIMAFDFKGCVKLHKSALELFRGNFEEDIQQVINTYIRDYNRYCDFYQE